MRRTCAASQFVRMDFPTVCPAFAGVCRSLPEFAGVCPLVSASAPTFAHLGAHCSRNVRATFAQRSRNVRATRRPLFPYSFPSVCPLFEVCLIAVHIGRTKADAGSQYGSVTQPPTIGEHRMSIDASVGHATPYIERIGAKNASEG